MSWDEYIAENLMSNFKGTERNLEFGAIIGLDGGVWAQSDKFPDISPEQIDALIAGFSDESAFQEKGIYLGEHRYVFIKGEPGSVIRGKKGATGFTAKKTETAFVIGGYGEGTQPGECNVKVEGLADDLIDDSI